MTANTLKHLCPLFSPALCFTLGYLTNTPCRFYNTFLVAA
ncbi:hypothetical protein DET0423 [Dehalococcoides mccartyi 195]|uniref:Uncharacterized protein n=1 Tax=Dehalococcoides mccartyi (strain ATCC BAA-2266 / KCTC 15142 / 195) TaxID=243164 RepID=Q3Z9D2_DEHM1|nr:hypothetical protein DET0423 [Dehalococcoides mccartyi 195]